MNELLVRLCEVFDLDPAKTTGIEISAVVGLSTEVKVSRVVFTEDEDGDIDGIAEAVDIYHLVPFPSAAVDG